MGVAIAVVVLLLVLLVIVLASSIRILREYERGVIFRLGRLIAQKGPGLILLIPIIDRMVRVDLRTVRIPATASINRLLLWGGPLPAAPGEQPRSTRQPPRP